MAGIELLIDALECDAERLRSLGVVRAVCEQVVSDLRLNVVGEPQWHVFPEPGGVTGLYLLSESHLTCHTFPEFGLATFNLYCCRAHPECDWVSLLSATLSARRIRVRRVNRGEPNDSAMETLTVCAPGDRATLLTTGAPQ